MMNQRHQETNLYEIPNCSICLVEMTQELSALNCGHVYHSSCLMRHLDFRGTCPNCQKRSQRQEIKPVFFPLVKNTQSAMMMRQILGSISTQQRNQVQQLFQKLKIANEKSEKLEYDLKQSEKYLKRQKDQLNKTKTEFNKTKTQLQTLKRDISSLKQLIQNLQIQNKRVNSENLDLNLKLDEYKQKDSQYEKYKILKRKTIDNSAALILYKQQLEAKQTPDRDMAKIFFDMIMIKNLEVLKLKNEKEIFPHKIAEKQEQISQFKQKLQRERKQNKELQQKQVNIKKRYDDLKVKYKNLAQKYKLKCNQGISDEDNYEDSMLSRPSFPIFPTSTSNAVSKSSGNISTFIKQQNIPMNENKPFKKNSSGFFDSILEEDQIRESSKVNQSQNPKKPAQQSLNNFVTQKTNFVNPFGSFGGISNKKKPEEKKVGGMKSLF